jgi:hypothetical protein
LADDRIVFHHEDTLSRLSPALDWRDSVLMVGNFKGLAHDGKTTFLFFILIG